MYEKIIEHVIVKMMKLTWMISNYWKGIERKKYNVSVNGIICVQIDTMIMVTLRGSSLLCCISIPQLTDSVSVPGAYTYIIVQKTWM